MFSSQIQIQERPERRNSDIPTDNDALRRRLSKVESQLQAQIAITREVENERRAITRTCSLLTDEIKALKGKQQDLTEFVESQARDIQLLETSGEEVQESVRRPQRCNCLDNDMIKMLELEHENTRKLLRTCIAQLNEVQTQQTAVVRKCDDFRIEMSAPVTDKPPQYSSLRPNEGETLHPSTVPIDEDRRETARGASIMGWFSPKTEADILRSVWELNEQISVVAHTICGAVSCAYDSVLQNPVNMHFRSSVRNLLGECLCQHLQRGWTGDSDYNDYILQLAVQSTLSYLISRYVRSWPFAPPLLLDSIDGNRDTYIDRSKF